MTWTVSEILAMLRRAKQVGALSPDPHAESPLGEIRHPELDTGNDLAGEPVHQPHPDPGPEV